MPGDSGAEEHVKENKPLNTNAISSAEFLCGAKRSGEKIVTGVSEKCIRFFTELPFNGESAVVSARIAHTLSGSAGSISISDELTAAIALCNNEPLVLKKNQPFAAFEALDLIVCQV
jgi:predicted nucleic acid-binding protein